MFSTFVPTYSHNIFRIIKSCCEIKIFKLINDFVHETNISAIIFYSERIFLLLNLQLVEIICMLQSNL